MKLATGILTLLVACTSYACYSDFDCGYGNSCIKPAGSYGAEGVCARQNDAYGNRTYNNNQQNTVHEVQSCSFNTDCEFGYKCYKQFGQVNGVCAR